MNEINAHAPTSLRERVYLELRDEVLGGRIGPTERLTEPRLSKRFGVSRTPVRDALTRLVGDGLLAREEWGYSVVVPSMARVRDIYEVRIAVELRGSAAASRTRRCGTTSTRWAPNWSTGTR